MPDGRDLHDAATEMPWGVDVQVRDPLGLYRPLGMDGAPARARAPRL